MDLIFSTQAWSDYVYWQSSDKKTVKKIKQLLKAVLQNPYGGIGKPEQLKYQLQGYWSRRIDLEHRLVYKVSGGQLIIISCRYHY